MTLPIDTLQLPADVRAGGPKAQKLYASALDFEKLLTTQLAQSLSSALGTGDDPSDGSSADDGSDGVTSGGTDGVMSQLQSQLPGQLASAVQQGGGLGLAPVLYRALVARDAAK